MQCAKCLKHADIKNPKPELADLGYNSYLWQVEIESVGCANATHRRPTFPIEIPILLYRVAKGEWKIKKVVDESAVTRRIYNPIKYRPRVVRAPYPGPMEG